MAALETFTRVRGGLLAFARHDNLILSGLAVVVGVVVGWAVVGFRSVIDLVQTAGFGSGGEKLATIVAALPWWQVMLVPAAGGLLIGVFYRYVMPGGGPQAVAHVIEASALRGGRLPLWPGIAATVGSAASIGVGASVGREGPEVLLGATLSSWLGQKLNYGRPAIRILLGCGGGAAVAASFNAPIAGALFAHEVIIGHYALSAFAPVVLASVAATMVSRAVYGAYPAFIIPPFAEIEWIEFPAFVLAGIACGIAAVILMRGIGLARVLGDKISLPQIARPAVAGLIVGLIAIAYPDILGVGYEQTDRALNNYYPMATLLILIAAKLVATAVCLGWGFGGGVFSPSLALGALIGAAVGVAVTAIGQDLSSGPAAYALVGMGATAAAVLGAPISTTLIIFELTGDYTLTIAVMAAVVIATLVSAQLFGFKSFFLAQLHDTGIDVEGGADVSGIKGTKVAAFVTGSTPVCRPETPRREVRATLLTHNLDEICAVDADGRLLGFVTGFALGQMPDDALDQPVEALIEPSPTVVRESQPVESAVRLLLAAGSNRLPVVGDDNVLRGSITARDLLGAVDRARVDAEAEARGALQRRKEA